MEPTDASDPQFYHRVVECQWACPAHTDVPEYIRLIAQGEYAKAYILNRRTNVFPGILGRTCDRPCEPACRRGRVDGKPVAICRLKRVAADAKGSIESLMPAIPAEKNGKRIACIGAGPASLALANDLMPLGYEVTVFEAAAKLGGLMRSNIPAFRLPVEVLDEEIASIVDMGVDVRYSSPVESLRSLLGEGYDAIFIGSGAPKGKDMKLEGRNGDASGNIHIGIEWLQSVAFGHVTSIGSRVLVIGVGNTAMDCCRTALRTGGEDVKVMARRPREFFKASEWELDDAEEEGVEVVVNHAPRRFVTEGGKLVGMEFDIVEWDEGARSSTTTGSAFFPCDDVILAVGQENAFTWVERDLGLELDEWGMLVTDPVTHQTTLPGVFVGGDAAWGPKNIVTAVAHAHAAAISIDSLCRGLPVGERPMDGMTLSSQKMGLTQWSYYNDYNSSPRQAMEHVALARRLSDLGLEVEVGFNAEQAAREVQRCLNCDVQPIFRPSLCIECDACIDICPVQCLSIVQNEEDESVLRSKLNAPTRNPDEPLFVSTPLPQTGQVMVQDEDLCVHCGLCAERCPTGAWNMEKFELNLAYLAIARSRRVS